MKAKKKKTKYKAVNLPEEILEEVDKIVTKDSYYHSRAEFVKESIREKIKNVEKTEKIWDQFSTTSKAVISILREDPA